MTDPAEGCPASSRPGREQARLIGKIILARFLESSLKRFERFIEEVEGDTLFKTLSRRGLIVIRRFPGAGVAANPDRMNGRTIGLIRHAPHAASSKDGRDFTVHYRHPGFGMEYLLNGKPCLPMGKEFETLTRRLRLITTRNRITHEVIYGVLSHQRDYFFSGNPLDLRPLSLTYFSRIIRASQGADTLIDPSRISRLINGRSIIVPSGKERPLKFLFPTGRDIHKHFIIRILSEERVRLNSAPNPLQEAGRSGKTERPFSDEEIREKLIRKHGLSITRRQVAFCRQEMGVPNLYQRYNNHRYPPGWATFSAAYPLCAACVQKNAPAGPGIYELALKRAEIEYPQGTSHLFYIGSAKNIRERLKEHLRAGTKNGGIKKQLKEHECSFRFSRIENDWHEKEKELYRSFVEHFGASPLCNKISP